MNIKYKRCQDFNKPTLFTNNITGNDIIQGSIGDCWLLQSLSSIAENRPDLIYDAFQPKTINPLGFYLIKLKNLIGQDSYILIDDYLPIDTNNKLKYTKAVNVYKIYKIRVIGFVYLKKQFQNY